MSKGGGNEMRGEMKWGEMKWNELKRMKSGGGGEMGRKETVKVQMKVHVHSKVESFEGHLLFYL